MKNIRFSLTVIMTCLISIGIIMIYSSSGVYALKKLGDPFYFLNRHLIFLLAGYCGMLCVMCIDYRRLSLYAKPMLIFSIVLLILVLIPGVGKESFGARRWFKYGPFSFQPSELTKLTMLIYVADYLSRKTHKVTNFLKGFLPPVIIMSIVCLLVVKQPDLGNSILIASIVLTMLFVAGAKIKHIASLGILALPALYFLVWMVPFRRARILAFLDPWQDSQGVGFQLSQSQIALGSGGFFGVGLGQSVQKLFYLPAAHTDFIFSIIGEELGLLGTLSVIFFFIAFIWVGAKIIKLTNDSFGYFLSIGILSMLAFQAVVNIGVSIGAFPTKGLPLPFISYGGSALIFNMMAVGLLLNISRTEDLEVQ